ncbi:type II toxin-antitoxin system VapC family toxin [Nocardia asteroides]|uniref:type II toxin-antitoxin system VapC family toxin n=1 Tax=Nocardia asteroides TaxID=1824 RepID=UPI00364EFFB8
MTTLYLDTCAVIKLFKDEDDTDALKRWLEDHASYRQVTSHLTIVELRRGLHACSAQPETHAVADLWLKQCARIALTADVLRKAGSLLPGSRLRALDAIHVAAALELGAALTYFVSYDKRLISAAEHHGLPVVSPT